MLLWLLAALVLPGALALSTDDKAAGALDWLLSLDLPLLLLLSVLVCTEIVSRAAQSGEHRWLGPAAERRSARFAFQVIRTLRALRWPAALVLAAALLAAGAGPHAEGFLELCGISVAATALGASMAGLLLRRSRDEVRTSQASRSRGLAALSWVPLRETARQLDLRRISLLALPVMLAAPMGVPAGEVALALMAWLPLLYLVTAAREAGNTSGAIRRWLRTSRIQPMQLRWLVWKHVTLAWLGSGIALWVTWQALRP